MSENKQLNEFTDLVNGIGDTELLLVAKGLMDDLATIANMREKISMLEEGLSTEDRAVFYFFTLGLDEEQMGLAADAVTGRLRFLNEKEEREKLGKEEEAAPEEPAEKEKVPVPLVEMTVPELRKVAAELNISGRSKMKKAELITAIKIARKPKPRQGTLYRED